MLVVYSEVLLEEPIVAVNEARRRGPTPLEGRSPRRLLGNVVLLGN